MECLFYLKKRPPLCQREFIFTGRSGRHLEKGYMYGPAVPFIKKISILPQGAAASFIKDIPNPVLYPPPRSPSGLRGQSEQSEDSPSCPRTVRTVRGQSKQSELSEDSPNSPRTV